MNSAGRSEKPTIKRRDMGLAGAIIVLAQVLASFRSTQSVSSEILKLRTDLVQVQMDQRKFFVRKEELKKVVLKLDKMNSNLVKLNEQIKRLGRSDYAVSKTGGINNEFD